MAGHYIVVGGSRGLGRDFSASLVSEGLSVSVIARSAGDLAGVRYHECDLQRVDAATILSAIRREAGEFDAIAFFQRYRDGDDAWDGEIRTSLTATKLLIEASVPHFAAHSLRSMVLVSSVNSAFISPALSPAYHVAKAGLCQLVRYYACALGPQGIRVNAVCPSSFVKRENESYYAAQPDLTARLAGMSPLNRMGTAREVNAAVRFLLSENASFITGQSLFVDGGISLRWHEHLP